MEIKETEKKKLNEWRSIRKSDNKMYKDPGTKMFFSKKNNYVIIYDSFLNINVIKKLLNNCRKQFNIPKEHIHFYIFIDDETMLYHSSHILAGRCFSLHKQFKVITIRIGVSLKSLSNKNAFFHVLWNELWHAGGEKGRRFPPKKVLKKYFKPRKK